MGERGLRFFCTLNINPLLLSSRRSAGLHAGGGTALLSLDKSTALMIAVSQNNEAMVHTLLDYHADVDAESCEHGFKSGCCEFENNFTALMGGASILHLSSSENLKLLL